MSEKNKVLNKTFDVKNETKQLQTKIDLLTNQLEWDRNKQAVLSQEESKLKQLIMEKKEYLYNLVRNTTLTICVIIERVSSGKYEDSFVLL